MKSRVVTLGREKVERYTTMASEIETQETKEAQIGLLRHQMWDALLEVAKAELKDNQDPTAAQQRQDLDRYSSFMAGLDWDRRFETLKLQVRRVKICRAWGTREWK